MRYLGIDPGTTRIGYGVVEENGGIFRSVTWGVIENAGTDGGADKSATAAELSGLIKKYNPTVAGIERLFFMNNARTAMSVAEMRGVIMLTLAQHGIATNEFTPQQVKKTLCGHGRATKNQMQDMVRLVLRIGEPVRPDDAADGLALALCCATAKKY